MEALVSTQCRPNGCRPLTHRSSPSRARAHTCTSAGPRRSRRPRTGRARTSPRCSRTSPAASAAPRATASGSPPTRSASTRRCGSTPRTSTPPSTSTRSAAERLDELADEVLSEPLRARPAAVGVLDRPRAGRRPHRPRRQGAPLHDRRARRGRARLAAARPRAGARGGRGRDRWLPAPTPNPLELLARGAWDRTREQLGPLRHPLELARAPLALPGFGVRAARALAGALLPVAPRSALNEPSSPDRHLATVRRPLAELRAIREVHGVTVNDVVLAAVAGALRRHAERRERAPARPQGDGAGQRARAGRR